MAKKAPKLFHSVLITDTSTEGHGIGRAGELVVFVPGAVPGDVVDVQVHKDRKKIFKGKILNLVKESDKRTNPPCIHFGICGGCKWQHMEYQWQLHFKQKHVYDAMTRIAGLDIVGWDDRKALSELPRTIMFPILGSKEIYGYRNRLDFAFSNRRWHTKEDLENGKAHERNALGFHVPGMFDRVVDITECHLMDSLSNRIRNSVKTFALENEISFYDIRGKSGNLRGQIMRRTMSGEYMCIVMFGDDDKPVRNKVLGHIQEHFPEITSLLYVINTKANDTIYDLDVEVFSGRDHIIELIDTLRFRVGPKAFYQTNPGQMLELYKLALDFAELSGKETVYDLYTGTGTIANLASASALKVIGIETIEAAVEDARFNSSLNGIHNTSFFAGDMKNVLTPDFIKQHGRPDVIITDPPRAGMDPHVCKRILETEAPRIVYVSCNPATQARDLAILKEKYRVLKIQPVDMFPQTAHVENVALLVIGH